MDVAVGQSPRLHRPPWPIQKRSPQAVMICCLHWSLLSKVSHWLSKVRKARLSVSDTDILNQRTQWQCLLSQHCLLLPQRRLLLQPLMTPRWLLLLHQLPPFWPPSLLFFPSFCLVSHPNMNPSPPHEDWRAFRSVSHASRSYELRHSSNHLGDPSRCGQCT